MKLEEQPHKHESGEDLSHNDLILDFCRTPSTQTAGRLIEFLRLSDDRGAVGDLARAMANSGETFSLPGRVADIASTGGPSSLSTLLCPLFLAQFGFVVPKLGVQGRPAGGIDVMAQLPGFEIRPSHDKVRGIIEQCRFAHILADDKYAPLDQVLFRFRQDFAAQDVPSLVAASILAKKIATGVGLAGLEVRTFPGGNFGSDPATARENAKMFVAVAKRLEIAATCFITDCTVPYQPLIGRGEALLALYNLFYGEPGEWLLAHAKQCWEFAKRLGNSEITNEDVLAALSGTRHVFESHISAHGASPTDFPKLVEKLKNQPRFTIKAQQDGYIVYDLAAIRNFIVYRQGSTSKNRFPDDAGIELLIRPDQSVRRGEPVIRVRCASSVELSPSERLFSIGPHPNDGLPVTIIGGTACA